MEHQPTASREPWPVAILWYLQYALWAGVIFGALKEVANLRLRAHAEPINHVVLLTRSVTVNMASLGRVVQGAVPVDPILRAELIEANVPVWVYSRSLGFSEDTKVGAADRLALQLHDPAWWVACD
ncbi:hypothetical protein BJY00DRAFT_313916 [Aspergillus carlsbadensis]|nr:hypothetical protein BJY00DRAFT_313916 [Aspergillus carlsbadensis]